MSRHLKAVNEKKAPPPPLTAEQRAEGERVLNQVADFIGQYVRFPSEHCLPVVSLWAAHTWAADKFYVTPRLVADSAEPQSGKTRVLELLNLVCRKPEMVLSPTTAAIFRMIYEDPMTLLFDEVDAVFNPKNAGNYEDLRALLNAGYKRGATIPRCVGDAAKMQVQRFKVFAPVALAGIAGNMPATITTRAITIHMRRRAAGEHVEPFYEEDAEEEAAPIAAALETWIGSIADHLGKARPETPAGVVDRPAEVWKAILAVADAAGDEWAKRAREACKHFVLGPGQASLSLGIRLLSDLREVFTVRRPDGTIAERRARMSTVDIIDALVGLEEAPWSDLRGKPLDARRLSSELKKYDVLRKTFNGGNGSVKGYMVAGHADSEGESAGLGDAWSRYLPPQAEKVGNPGNSGNSAGQPVTEQMAVTGESVTGETAVTPLSREVTEVSEVTGYCGVCSGPLDPALDGDVHPTCEAAS